MSKQSKVPPGSYPTQQAGPSYPQAPQPVPYGQPPPGPYGQAPPPYSAQPMPYQQQAPQGYYGQAPQQPMNYPPQNPQAYHTSVSQAVHVKNGFDAGARFDVSTPPSIPPPPPGCLPTAGQMAVAHGQNVVMTQKKDNYVVGGSDGGYVIF